MSIYERLKSDAMKAGERGAHLGHFLQRFGGGRTNLRLRQEEGLVKFVLDAVGETRVRESPVYKDALSGMEYFFAVLPLAYLHHDDRINARTIGSNVRGLIEEFLRKRPQLHIGLAWWNGNTDGIGPVKVFDGQHKAAAQMLLDVAALPVRVFLRPDLNVLLQANTNAGDKLRQVAFDTAILRHLGSTLYVERARQYQEMKGLLADDYSFSEQQLVNFFRGEHREVLRYILDAQRDAVAYNKDNRLMGFVEWAGKSAERPLSYSTIDGTFFKQFIYKKALTSPIQGSEDNPRVLEREQLVKLMNVFATIVLEGQWDPDKGGRQIEHKLQKGDVIPEAHLRAWRITRQEILENVMQRVHLIIQNYYAYAGIHVEGDRVFQRRLPDEAWARIERFLRTLIVLPCWVDKNLSSMIFGVKHNLDYWDTIFQTGKSPDGHLVLLGPLDVMKMIREPAPL